MNSSQRLQTRVILVLMMTGLIALACFLIVLLNVRSRDQAAVEQLRMTVRELRVQLDDRDRTILDLKASVERLQTASNTTSAGKSESKPDLSLKLISELQRRITEMGSTQTQILAFVQKAAAKNSAVVESLPWTAKERQAALAVLEEAQKEHEQKSAAAKKRVEQLLMTLRVPNEIAALPTERALSAPSAYWPYFEARRELEGLQLVVERLKLRLTQEQIDSRIQERAKSQ